MVIYSPTSIFSKPASITVRLPFGISKILRIRAEVPILCISSGCGSSTALSICNTAPSRPSAASTARTKAIDLARPTVMGVTEPGNITELRNVRMGSTSGIFTCSMLSSPPEIMGIT